MDLEKGVINVNHQLQRKRNMEYIIEDTKTDSGTRLVPMVALHWGKYFQHICEKYNKIYKVKCLR